MIVLIIFLICVFMTLIVGCLAGLSDIKSMTIPNTYSVYVLCAFVIAYTAVFLSGTEGVMGALVAHALSFGVTFGVTFVLFALKVIGAGDSKFASVCALWLQVKYMPVFLFFMTLVGGVLGCVALYIKRRKPFEAPAEGSWVAQVQDGKDKVPYGVAISFGMLIAFMYAGYFSTDVLSSFLIEHSAGSGS